jgi:nucleotide-binding universal stress UspA family protein
MLRSILVGLDGSAPCTSAMEVGIEWARRFDALLVGLAIVDEPTIAAAAPVILGGPPYTDPIIYRERMADARRQVEQFLEQFALRCAEARVACKVLEDVGLPCEQIALEAQRYDLILLGQKTRFHFEIQERRDDTLTKVLKGSPRPVVVVPETWAEGHSVVVAYDGSLAAARALHAFQGTGLERSRDIHVVSVHPDRKEAARHAERAVDYLRFHEIRAAAHPLASSGAPAEAILGQLRDLGAGLLVMGAYGQPTLREFFLGSTTSTMLRESPVPLFLFH